MPVFFRKMPTRFSRHLIFMLSSDLVSPRTVEGLKQKPQTQQVIHFFQEAGYGLRFGNESVDRIERSRWQALISRQKRDGNIGLSNPHAKT
jgi:hypothetical protein